MVSRRSKPGSRGGSAAPAGPRLPNALEEVTLDLADPTDLRDARITELTGEGDLDDVELVGCTLEGVRLTAMSARRLRLIDVVLRDCELSGLDLTEARLLRVRVVGCRAEMLEAGMVHASDVVVVDSKLTSAGLRMARLERVRLEGSDLRGVELLEATLESVVIEGCDLTGADLRGARMSDVALKGSDLDGVLGAEALAGATIDPSQVIPVALALFSSLGIRLADPEADQAGS